MAPRISSAKLIKSRPKVPSGTSIDEPGNGSSEEYHLSHRVHHLLTKSNPLESVLASFGRCPRLQFRSEPLQEHLPGWGTNNSPSSSNCMKLPYDSHAYSSKCKGGTLTLGKSQTKRAPDSPEVPFRLAREIFFTWKRSQGQSRDFPHLVQSHAQFAYSGEESPCSWTL